MPEIYEAIEKGRYVTLSERHLAKSYGRPSYQHEVRSIIANLKEKGCIQKFERAHYKITTLGKRRIHP